MRLWEAFKTKEDQRRFEEKMKQESEMFRVCMRMSGRALERDLHMTPGKMEDYNFVTVYTFD